MCPFFLLKARVFFQGKVRSGIEGFRTVDLTQTITLYLCVVGDVPAHGAPLWVSISQCSLPFVIGVRVNLVAGGLLERTDASSLTTDVVFGYVAGATPLRKTTTVEDFAKACVFFAAEASDAVTGQSLSVDGGLTMP